MFVHMPADEKTSILYFAPRRSSFVNNDLEGLAAHFRVRFFGFDARPKALLPLLMFKQLRLFFVTTNNTIWVSRFAGFHSFLPSLIGRVRGVSHVIILGGTDCNALPSIGYGNATRSVLRWVTDRSMRWATHLLPLSEQLVYSRTEYSSPDVEQGFRVHYPQVTTGYTVVPLGVDATKFRMSVDDPPRNERSFVTICSGLAEERRRKLKGVDLFVDLAARFPDCSFTVIGGERYEGCAVHPNLSFIRFVDHQALPQWLNAHGCYVQLSLSEGFSNALLEAMSCGCVPLVSAVGAMPEIVGQLGHVVHERGLEHVEKELNRYLNQLDSYDRSAISKSVAQRYRLNQRIEALSKVFRELVRRS